MIQLLKKVEDRYYYWSFFKEGVYLYKQHGILGEYLKEENHSEEKFSRFYNMDKLIRDLTEEKVKEGYTPVEESDYTELVIQFSYKDGEEEAALDKRQQIEEEINDILGFTGNGFWEGGDVGSGSTNIFCFVIDIELAKKAILEFLEENSLLSGVKIAFEKSPESGKYICIYPENSKFDII